MFTGIIEAIGKIEKIEKKGSNVHFTLRSPISNELKVDQSVSHNGVCLTIEKIPEGMHTVTAIAETLNRTCLGNWTAGTLVNLERAISASARLDGHFVQGHVDTTGQCIAIKPLNGSWHFTFEYALKPEWLLVDKGSICINGVSLTVVEPIDNRFSVAIIPYTYENTIFKQIKVGDEVNLEFDIIGKYINKYMKLYK